MFFKVYRSLNEHKQVTLTLLSEGVPDKIEASKSHQKIALVDFQEHPQDMPKHKVEQVLAAAGIIGLNNVSTILA